MTRFQGHEFSRLCRSDSPEKTVQWMHANPSENIQDVSARSAEEQAALETANVKSTLEYAREVLLI